jgi:hypothetical protein
MFDIDNQNGIVLEFCGGLGNRIWQLAAAIITALKYNQSIYLDKSICVNHGGKSVDYFSNVFKDIGIDTRTTTPPSPKHSTYYIQFMISTEAYTIENLNFPIYTTIEPFNNYNPLNFIQQIMSEQLERNGLPNNEPFTGSIMETIQNAIRSK